MESHGDCPLVRPSQLKSLEFLSNHSPTNSSTAVTFPNGFSYHRSPIAGGSPTHLNLTLLSRSPLSQPRHSCHDEEKERMMMDPSLLKHNFPKKKRGIRCCCCFASNHAACCLGCCSSARLFIWFIIALILLSIGLFIFVYWPQMPHLHLAKISTVLTPINKQLDQTLPSSSVRFSPALYKLKSEWEFYNPNEFPIPIDEVGIEVYSLLLLGPSLLFF
jgi:hypothetical protein